MALSISARKRSAGGRVLGDDRVGVVRAVAVDMGDRAVDPVDDAHREDRVEIFGASNPPRSPAPPAGRAHAPRGRRAPRILPRADRRGSAAASLAATARSTSSVSVAPQIETRRILALSTMARAFSGSAARVDIGVAEAFEMGDDRNAAFALHPLDQRGAAARHDDVDDAAHLQHHADRRAVAGRDQLDRRLRQAGGGEAVAQRGDERPRGMEALRAAAQDRGVAGFERQPAGVGGDVGAALVDDADDAERHADARDPEPVGPGPVRQHVADRVGQRGDVFEPRRHRFEPLRVERQAVEQRRADPGARGLAEVVGIGGEDLVRRASAPTRQPRAAPPPWPRAGRAPARRPLRGRRRPSSAIVCAKIGRWRGSGQRFGVIAVRSPPDRRGE